MKIWRNCFEVSEGSIAVDVTLRLQQAVVMEPQSWRSELYMESYKIGMGDNYTMTLLRLLHPKN